MRASQASDCWHSPAASASPHLALTRGAFTDALPEPVGALPLATAAHAEIEAWRKADGPLGGRDIDFGVSPLVSFVVEEGEYAVAKILRDEIRTVHLRLYSDRWHEPPTDVNPWELRLDPGWAQHPGVGHMPLARNAFSHSKPELLRLAMVARNELEGYAHWKAEGGGVFG